MSVSCPCIPWGHFVVLFFRLASVRTFPQQIFSPSKFGSYQSYVPLRRRLWIVPSIPQQIQGLPIPSRPVFADFLPSEADSLKFISSIYPICGLKDIPSGVYLPPAAVLFFNMSVKSLYHSSSRVPRRVFPQEESPHRVRVSDHFGSLARVHLHFACSNHCILKTA